MPKSQRISAGHARPDRRRYKRVTLLRKARMLDNNGREHVCDLLDISGNGARVQTPNRAKIGDNVILYSDELGRLSGQVVRLFDDGFAMRIQAPALKRDKIVDTLTWLINCDILHLSDERRADRISGSGRATALLGDGRMMNCEVLDISLTGVALASREKWPLIGETIQVGRAVGCVARYFETGFAVDFGHSTMMPPVYDPVLTY